MDLASICHCTKAIFFGMLRALLALHRLLATQQCKRKKLSGTLWCNNKSAVTRLNNLEDSWPFSLTIANCNDTNIMQELRYWKAKLQVTITASWVKSHQEQCDTKEARLNQIVDHIAGMKHDKQGPWASSRSSKMLPRTITQLVIQGEQ